MARTGRGLIPNAAVTFLPWDALPVHNYNMGLVGSRVTIPVDGIYLLTLMVPWDAHTTGRTNANVRVNGVTTLGADANEGTAVESTVVTGAVELHVGDILEVVVYQNSGASLYTGNTTGDISERCNFTVTRISV